MIDYIRYHIARYSKRVPNNMAIKIRLLRRLNPDIYKYDSLVTVSTINVTEAIRILGYSNGVDWDTEYAMINNSNITGPRNIFISKWYSINGNFVNQEIFNKWLTELDKCYNRYLVGITMDISTRSYMNSVKLKLLISEGESIINMILIKNGYTFLN